MMTTTSVMVLCIKSEKRELPGYFAAPGYRYRDDQCGTVYKRVRQKEQRVLVRFAGCQITCYVLIYDTAGRANEIIDFLILNKHTNSV